MLSFYWTERCCAAGALAGGAAARSVQQLLCSARRRLHSCCAMPARPPLPFCWRPRRAPRAAHSTVPLPRQLTHADCARPAHHVFDAPAAAVAAGRRTTR